MSNGSHDVTMCKSLLTQAIKVLREMWLIPRTRWSSDDLIPPSDKFFAFPYTDARRFLEVQGYHLLHKVLGCGSFGWAYSATSLPRGDPVAIKRVACEESADVLDGGQEIEMSSRLKVGLLGSCTVTMLTVLGCKRCYSAIRCILRMWQSTLL